MIRNFISKLYSLYTPSIFMSGGGSPSGYVIDRSLRFSSASSQSLSRTPSVAGNQRIWSWSGLVKLGTLTSPTGIFEAGSTSNNTSISFNSNCIMVQDIATTSYNIVWKTLSIFRDPSALYHIVVIYNTTEATAANAVKVYVNGVQQSLSFTAFAGSYLQNRNSFINGNIQHRLGTYNGLQNYLDGYMSEVHFIDGQALTPSSFGEINPATGQWVAKKYTGTYGTNGSYLDFKDGTSTTTLGNDKSGNGNNWTLTNFTRSAGVNDCWMRDVPAGNGSASAVQPNANYCVLNPLKIGVNQTLTNGNLSVSGSLWGTTSSTFSVKTGKYYWEGFSISSAGSAANPSFMVGVSTDNSVNQGSFNASGVFHMQDNGDRYTNGSSLSRISGVSIVTNDVMMFAYDADAGKLWIGKGGTWFNSGNPVAGTGEIYSGIPTTGVTPSVAASGGGALALNFGQRSFAYTPPTGFIALCTANLTSTDVIESGSFTGNASADGPFIWCNGTPETLTINGNAVTWGTHADKLANGFKLRTSSSSYNSSGTNTWTATILSPESKSAFKHQNAKGN